MGGLVGGLYATGKSPEDLKEIVEKQKWDTIIGGRTPYDDLSFRRKEDQRALPNYLILGLKKGLTLPGGLNLGAIGGIVERNGKRSDLRLHGLQVALNTKIEPSFVSGSQKGSANMLLHQTGAGGTLR